MQDLKLSLVQSEIIWQNPEANFKHYERLIKGVQTDVLILPEMFNTGFSIDSKSLAEPFDSSLSIKWLLDISKKMNSAIYTSLIIEQDGKFFNRGCFVYPDGKLSYYDKRHLFSMAGEDKYFTPGQNKVFIKFKDWKISLQICYDLRFPVWCRESDADLILFVANWPEKRVSHWTQLLKARAIENQCFVAGCNRVGVDGLGLDYSGDSLIVDAKGNVIADAEPKSTKILQANLSVDSLKSYRRKFPAHKDRDHFILK